MLAQTQMVKRGAKALERLMNDKANIYTMTATQDPITGIITKNERTLLYSEVRCSLSTTNVAPQGEGDVLPVYRQMHKIFLPNTVSVPPGAIYEVTHGGSTSKYVGAGTPIVYGTHIEVSVTREDVRHGR